MKQISLVIPVFRNEGSLQPTYQQVLSLFKEQLTDFDYEFIFVNDGSDDNSMQELLQIRSADPKVKVIDFTRNFGQVPAMVAGMKEASGQAIIAMSADLQDPVDLIAQMVSEWQHGNEIVICYRVDREDSIGANIASKFFYGLMKISNHRMPVGGFDFILLDETANEQLQKIDERNRFIQGDILWLGYNTKFIPYKRLKREIGKSQWTLAKKIKYFIDGFINTSYLPIRFISLLGFITALSGFIYALVIIYLRIVNETPFKGWAPIMVLLLIIGGIIMNMLGIIGEYIWRIYDESRKRPYYIIKKKYID